MARKGIPGAVAETIEEKLDIPVTEDFVSEESAPTPAKAKAAKAPEPVAEIVPAFIHTTKRYKVTEAKRVLLSGYTLTLNAGKIVDNSNYDIDLLKSQGVSLVEVE